MPLITDWLMVGITLVYVVATIMICVFNGRSAKATREQVSESQRQFEETKRLGYRPYFDILPADNNFEYNIYDTEITLHMGCPKWQESTLQAELWTIKNIGAGTAVNLSYRWESEGNEIQIGELPFATLEKEEANLTFFHIKIALMPQYAAYQTKASLYIIYQDLLENKYEQEVVLTYDVSTSDKTELTDMIVHAPKLVK
jgi:hypothetical protein